MPLLPHLKFFASELNNFRFDLFHSLDLTKNEEEKKIVNEILTKGYYVFPEYYSREWCEEAVREMEALMEKYANQMWRDDEDADHRLYGINRVSNRFDSFYHDDKINRLLTTCERAPVKAGFTLGGKIIAREHNKGSGGGWHRDSVYSRQLKSIAYLTAVDDDNGPFQYLEGSHRLDEMRAVSARFGFPVYNNRFSDELMEQIIGSMPDKLKTFTAKAGTVILIDTRGLHRGMPIRKGIRYALTNYIWIRRGIPKHIEKLTIN